MDTSTRADINMAELQKGVKMIRASVSALASAIALFSSPAFGSEYVLDVKALQGQESTYSSGQEMIADPLQATVIVILEPRPISSKQVEFAIGVVNRGDAPLNFGPENVSIKLPDGTIVAMLDYNELMRRQKKREGRQRFAMAMLAGSRGASASQAGYTSGTASYSGTSNGYYGTTPYNSTSRGSATYSEYDSGKANAAQAQANLQNQRDAEAMRANQNAERGRVGQVMQTTTVPPAQMFYGVVQFDIPKAVRSKNVPVPIVIEVRAGNEVHTFEGTLTKR